MLLEIIIDPTNTLILSIDFIEVKNINRPIAEYKTLNSNDGIITFPDAHALHPSKLPRKQSAAT